MYSDPESEGLLLVDANNVLNRLNRHLALANITCLCPTLSKILINIYRDDTELFVDGESIFSREGTTKDDSVSMPNIHYSHGPNDQQITLFG